jgi:hypothetical protein
MPINLEHARPILCRENIDLAADFYTLPASAACTLVELAQSQGYRRPRGANGSTARYYFAALQRLNRKKEQP